MPPKRAGGTLTSKTARKVPKIINEQVEKNTGVKETSTSQFQKLERVLQRDDCDSYALDLMQKIVKTSDLPFNLAIRLLKFCIKTENENLAREIINCQSIDLKTPEGGDRQAVNAGNAGIASLLVRAGADLSIRDSKYNCTPLQQVLISFKIKNDAKREELVCLMLDYGADINARDNQGHSVLHCAIRYEHCSSQLVEELMKRGANVTFGGEFHLDDICSAARHKPELLLKLIQHQVANEEMKNKRGILALEDLILMKHNATVLHAMKEILNLGVPVNTTYEREERSWNNSCPLLSTALFLKKKDAIKLLLENGADPHQKDDLGRTPLFLATSFKGYTHASRWLIERGASIHVPNNDGRYPIHGACMNESLRNIHLFLNLGADLNITDDRGRTPFSYTRDTFYFNEAHSLVIKHFALIIAKGGTISDEDIASANQYVWGNHHFKKCTEQLEKMKVENIYDDVSYFSLLSENICKLLRLMEKPTFIKNCKRNSKKRTEMFPEYSYMLLHSFEIAEMRYKVLFYEKKHVQEAFGSTMPDRVVEKIAYYLCFENLIRCQHDYYMSLHESLKNNKADKEKIQ